MLVNVPPDTHKHCKQASGSNLKQFRSSNMLTLFFFVTKYRRWNCCSESVWDGSQLILLLPPVMWCVGWKPAGLWVLVALKASELMGWSWVGGMAITPGLTAGSSRKCLMIAALNHTLHQTDRPPSESLWCHMVMVRSERRETLAVPSGGPFGRAAWGPWHLIYLSFTVSVCFCLRSDYPISPPSFEALLSNWRSSSSRGQIRVQKGHKWVFMKLKCVMNTAAPAD